MVAVRRITKCRCSFVPTCLGYFLKDDLCPPTTHDVPKIVNILVWGCHVHIEHSIEILTSSQCFELVSLFHHQVCRQSNNLVTAPTRLQARLSQIRTGTTLSPLVSFQFRARLPIRYHAPTLPGRRSPTPVIACASSSNASPTSAEPASPTSTPLIPDNGAPATPRAPLEVDLIPPTIGGWLQFLVKLRMLIAPPWQRVRKGSVFVLQLGGSVSPLSAL